MLKIAILILVGILGFLLLVVVGTLVASATSNLVNKKKLKYMDNMLEAIWKKMGGDKDPPTKESSESIP